MRDKWRLPDREASLTLIAALWDLDADDVLNQDLALDLLDLIAAATFLQSYEFNSRLAEARDAVNEL